MQGMIGRTIGRYRITEHLGRGGMAEVYKAYQPSLDRYVAIKLMHTFLADDKDFLARFEREAKVVATLRHPNIVQVHDFDVDNGQYYMVMEYIDGVTLKTMLETLHERDEWLSLDDAVKIILSVGSALRYAHERKMVHRDVKPANVMITKDGHVILTDFGIAKIMSVTGLTASGAMVGTPSYMSPEQGMGETGDERSDIYSLGVMLYQLAVGRLPYDADTPLAVVLKHINDPLPLPRKIKPDLTEDIERAILKALAKSPDDRYQTVAEIMADLKRATGLPADITPPDMVKSGSAIQLTGATVVGRIGAATPPPPGSASPALTVARMGASQTVTAPRDMAETAHRPEAQAAGRSKWLIPIIVIGLIAIVAGGGVLIAASSQAPATPTATLTPPPTLQPSPTEFKSPDGRFTSDNVDLHEGPSADSPVKGQVSNAFGKFSVRARSSDSQWLKIEFPDGTTGWVVATAVDMGNVDVSEIPLALTLATPTPTPTWTPTSTPTSPPTGTPTITDTPAPTRPSATRPPATRPPATATQPSAPTATTAAIALGWGFEYQFCTFDGDNYTCNVRIWGSGGDGKYHYAVENPDTGNWDEKTGLSATYLIRSRRCRIRIQQIRIWDESGNHVEPNLTTDPSALASLFPGGTCTEP